MTDLPKRNDEPRPGGGSRYAVPLAESLADPTAALRAAESGEPVVVVKPDGSTDSVIAVPKDDRPYAGQELVPREGLRFEIAAPGTTKALTERVDRLLRLLAEIQYAPDEDGLVRCFDCGEPKGVECRSMCRIDAELGEGGAA